jgi:hypothetical protein
VIGPKLAVRGIYTANAGRREPLLIALQAVISIWIVVGIDFVLAQVVSLIF